MFDFFSRLFSADGFPPRWHCGDWSSFHGWLYIVSDLGVWSAYTAIPAVLMYFVWKKATIPFKGIFLLFGAFILACGLTHLIDAVMFWWPAYRLLGMIEFLTAAVSWATVIALVPIVPRALSMRTPEELEREVEARRKAEIELQRVNHDLERRIQERTAELVNANASLHREREWFKTTLASICDAVIATNVEGQVTFLNSVARALTGWSEEEAKSKPLQDVFRIVNENTHQPAEDPAARALREGAIVGLANHTVLISKSGEERPVDDSAAPIRDHNGDVVGVVLVFRDVTERRRGEFALRESEERSRSLLEFHQAVVANMGEGLYAVDKQGLVTFMNPAAEALFGWTCQELVGRKMHEMTHHHHPDGSFFPAEDCSGFQVLHNGIVVKDYEDHFIKKDGTFFNVSYSSAPLASNGTIDGLVVVFRDATEQKRAEGANRLLADVSAALVGSLHYPSVLREVADLTVPFLGDLCFFDMVTTEGEIERVAWKHVDKEKSALSDDVRRFVPSKNTSRHPILVALRTGKPVMVSEVTDAWLQTIASTPEHLSFLRKLEMCSVMTVPMRVGERSLGTMTFANCGSQRRHTPEMLALAQEIARRTALTMENAALIAQLREADRKKDEFLALLAHELRNPLAPIRNAVEFLRLKGPPEPPLQEAREMIERQITHMVRLVDDLLDVSRITRGKVDLHVQYLEIAKIIETATETSRPLIEAAKQELFVDLPSAPITLEGDLTRLAQVVSNLLNNSAKYTGEGGRIWLSVKQQGDQVVISVKDNGMGIPAKMLHQVFEMFTQVDRTLGRSQGGLGIGLTVVRRVVEMHGGTVEAHSEGLDKGSEFVVRWPLVAKQPIGELNQIAANDGEQNKTPRRRILVVDDNPDSAQSLAMLLRVKGNEVRVAHDGLSALQVAKEFRPELVLLDIGLPGMDGYEVARRMRQMPETKDSLLVAQTGWGQEEDRHRSQEAGFNDHLVKPLELGALQSLLNKLSQKP